MQIDTTQPLFWVISAIVASGLIEISPIKINPWKWVARKIGNALNADLIDKINSIDADVKALNGKLDDHVAENEEEKMNECRRRILNFNDKVITNYGKITKERYDNILEDIDKYERYCREHPDYPNNKCVLAIENLKRDYQERY